MADPRSSNKGEKPGAETLGANETSRGEGGHRASAQNIWRLIIVFVLVILGLSVGFWAGTLLVRLAQTTKLEYIVSNQSIAVVDEILFGIIGALIAFLIGSSAFNKIFSLAENVQGMKPNEKVAIFLGVAAGLLLTVLLGQLLIPIGPIGWLVTVFIGVIAIYICTSATLGMKESFKISKRHA